MVEGDLPLRLASALIARFRSLHIWMGCIYLRVSAKVILGNQKKLSEWQTKYHEHMSQRLNELERGASAMETHTSLSRSTRKRSGWINRLKK